MSAYMVDRAHIDALVALALSGPSDIGAVRPDSTWSRLTWSRTDVVTFMTARERLTDELNATPGMTDDAAQARYRLLRAEWRREIDYASASDAGSMLIAANLASIHARYPDTIADPEGVPGPVAQYWTEPYAFPMVYARRLTAVQGLKAISGYEYQACEADTWHTSEAASFCAALRDALIRKLPGYDAAAWSIADARAEVTA